MLYLYLSKDHIFLQIGATTVKFVDLTLSLHGILSFFFQLILLVKYFQHVLQKKLFRTKGYCFQFVLYCKKKNT